ncbi:MAG: hypothetical protein KatS3mg038_2906 [Candidatus Kapaibacterium sp.]|nr:MAG: hypothetical protein KatS3mg038_2906 [Candidatus Kapabacteria bacterium]
MDSNVRKCLDAFVPHVCGQWATILRESKSLGEIMQHMSVMRYDDLLRFVATHKKLRHRMKTLLPYVFEEVVKLECSATEHQEHTRWLTAIGVVVGAIEPTHQAAQIIGATLCTRLVTRYLCRRWPEAEPVIAQDPECAYYYACDVIRGRWPEAEPVIAADAWCAYSYARDVIGGRWPEAEPVIAQDAESAYSYASRVIGGRWPEAEPVIAVSAYYAYSYARDVIYGRWPEAEPVIAADAWCAYSYARDVIGGRWPEAEPVIEQDPQCARYYQRIFGG